MSEEIRSNLFLSSVFSFLNSELLLLVNNIPTPNEMKHKAGNPKLIVQSGNLENQFSVGGLYKPLFEIILIQSFKKLII